MENTMAFGFLGILVLLALAVLATAGATVFILRRQAKREDDEG